MISFQKIRRRRIPTIKDHDWPAIVEALFVGPMKDKARLNLITEIPSRNLKVDEARLWTTIVGWRNPIIQRKKADLTEDIKNADAVRITTGTS